MDQGTKVMYYRILGNRIKYHNGDIFGCKFISAQQDKKTISINYNFYNFTLDQIVDKNVSKFILKNNTIQFLNNIKRT